MELRKTLAWHTLFEVTERNSQRGEARTPRGQPCPHRKLWLGLLPACPDADCAVYQSRRHEEGRWPNVSPECPPRSLQWWSRWCRFNAGARRGRGRVQHGALGQSWTLPGVRLPVQVSLLPFADSVTLGQVRGSTFFCFSFLTCKVRKGRWVDSMS